MKRQEEAPLAGGAQDNCDSRCDDPLTPEDGASDSGINPNVGKVVSAEAGP